MGRFAEHGRAAAPGAIALVLASQAHALVIETEVRLRGLDRRLSITVDEPGTPNQVLLEVSGADETFAIDSYDRRTGGLTAMREVEVGGQKKIEIVALFKLAHQRGHGSRQPLESWTLCPSIDQTLARLTPKLHDSSGLPAAVSTQKGQFREA